jgi:hypothetical protein
MISSILQKESLRSDYVPDISVCSADREALKLLMAEVVDVSIPITAKESFFKQSFAQMDNLDGTQSFADTRNQEVLAKIQRVFEERKKRFDMRLDNFKRITKLNRNAGDRDSFARSSITSEAVRERILAIKHK